MNREPRIAIVSDPLVQRGGAERVVEQLAWMFPEAPVYAILYSAKTGPRSLEGRVIPSFLQRIPGAVQRHRLFLPLYPAAIESFDLSGFDIIISSHHTAAKGVLRNAGQRHIAYCHTPMRALWERPHEELRSLPALVRPFAAAFMRRLRVWDLAAATRVDVFLANSEVTRTRILKHYGRASALVYPPCTMGPFTPSNIGPGDYYLVASRNVPYKRIDIAVEATRLARRKLIIAGCSSPAFVAEHVHQAGHVSDSQLANLMRGTRALLFPGYEDFGMTPVEVMACGRPVIAFAKGGALETVIDGATGVLVREQTAEAFAEAIHRFESMEFSSVAIRRNAERFSLEAFKEAIEGIVYATSSFDDTPANFTESAAASSAV
jgi:glycosyltransferase involved in cell wall biosynthesis